MMSQVVPLILGILEASENFKIQATVSYNTIHIPMHGVEIYRGLEVKGLVSDISNLLKAQILVLRIRGNISALGNAFLYISDHLLI